MLHAKELITHLYWRNADGPLDVRVYGRYTKDGLVIHGVSLDNTYPCGKPQLSVLPRPPVLLQLASIELKKDLLNGEQIKITTPAGHPSIAVWGGGILKRGPLPHQCTRGYRVEWRPRGRRKDSIERFASPEQAFDFVLSLIGQCDAKGRPVGIADIAKMLDHERPVKTPKGDRDPRSTEKWLYRLYKKMKFQSWNEVIQLARSRQKKIPS